MSKVYAIEMVGYIYEDSDYQNFTQVSIVEKSLDSYESALKKAYQTAFKKYKITSDAISTIRKWSLSKNV